MSDLSIPIHKAPLSTSSACIALALMVSLAIGLIGLVVSYSPRSGFVNCSMASFHPDFHFSVRQACRTSGSDGVAGTQERGRS